MQTQQVSKDKYICTEGQSLDAIHIIASGQVKATFPGGEMILKKGDIVGLCDIAYDSHFFTYTTLEDCSFVSFAIKKESSIAEIVKANPEIAKMLYQSMLNQIYGVYGKYARQKENCKTLYKNIFDYYEKYVDFCSHYNVISRSLPQFDSIQELSLEEEVEPWIVSYYASMKDLPQEVKMALYARPSYMVGFVKRASEDVHAAFSALETMNDYVEENKSVFMQESRIDMFDLYVSLLFRLKAGSPEADKVVETIESLIKYLDEQKLVSQDLLHERCEEYRNKYNNMNYKSEEGAGGVSEASAKELTNSIDVILQYAAVDDELANNFKKLITQYKKLSDKASTEDSARKLRTELTQAFYKIYVEAFKVSVNDSRVPTVLKMFFNFGYVDEELAGLENAAYLYSIADEFRGDSYQGVYTAYEWLLAIYNKQKEPSRNEFDTDYVAFLHEQKVQGKITPELETRLLGDPGERVMFELENMFPMVNKVTFGRISIFCPVFCESNVIKPLENCLVNVETIKDTFKLIESVDYGAFFRETVYVNEKIGIQKEYVAVKVTPDVILFPNVGTRGVMWQEIEGKKRTTPGRMMISVFHLEDIRQTFTRLTGEFRWEMCKREQGARWNDITDKSLTSEYCDYVQFYKKNNDLSQDAKEKVKQSLVKAKNSFKEMFVRDYITWIMFEGAGSPRLNKVARAILLTYCPFPKELREKIAANPLFKELIERYDVKLAQTLHRLDGVAQKIKNQNQPIPPELEIHRKYVEGTV